MKYEQLTFKTYLKFLFRFALFKRFYSNRKEEESLSASSTVTLTQQDTATTGIIRTVSEVDETITCSLPSSPRPLDENLRRSSSASTKDHSMEKDEKISLSSRRYSNVSTATLTNVRTPVKTCSKSDPVRQKQIKSICTKSRCYLQHTLLFNALLIYITYLNSVHSPEHFWNAHFISIYLTDLL